MYRRGRGETKEKDMGLKRDQIRQGWYQRDKTYG